MTTETHIELQKVTINRTTREEMEEAIADLEARGYKLETSGLFVQNQVTKSSYANHRPSKWKYRGSAEDNQKFKAVMTREYERVVQ